MRLELEENLRDNLDGLFRFSRISVVVVDGETAESVLEKLVEDLPVRLCTGDLALAQIRKDGAECMEQRFVQIPRLCNDVSERLRSGDRVLRLTSAKCVV